MYGFVALWLVVSWWALWPCGLPWPCSPVVGCGAVALGLGVASWLRGWPWLVAWGVGYGFVAPWLAWFVGCCCGLVACCWLWSVAGQLALALWPGRATVLWPCFALLWTYAIVRGNGFVACGSPWLCCLDWGFVAGGRLWVCSPMLGEGFGACG